MNLWIFLNKFKELKQEILLLKHYNAFQEGSQGTIPLPPPQEVGRVGAPPEIIQTFTSADATMQSILGSYDASLGINNNQLSGVAIVEGATQSNAAAMPYVVSFLQSLNQMHKSLLISFQNILLRQGPYRLITRMVNTVMHASINKETSILTIAVSN